MKIIFSNHAIERMKVRDITQEIVFEIMENPDFVISQNEEIKVFSKTVEEGNKLYLYRVFVTSGKNTLTIVTVYKTSKTKKYDN